MGWLTALSLWAWFPGPYGFAWPKIVLICLGLGWWAPRRIPAASAAMVAAVALSCLWSVDPSLSVLGFPGEWTACLLGALALAALSGIQTGTRWLKWAGVLLAIHCLSQRAGYDLFHHLPFGARASAWDGSPVDTGAVLAMAAPLAGLLLPVVAAGLWATGSRAACLAAACALLPGKTRWLTIPVVLAAMWFPHQPKDVWRRHLWVAAAQEFRARPLGTGVGTFVFTQRRLVPWQGRQQTHAHNDVLEAASTTGLAGLLAWLWLTIPLYSYPPLLALLIVMKFDPVAFEVLAIGALLCANTPRKKYVSVPVFAAGGLALAAYIFSLLLPLR